MDVYGLHRQLPQSPTMVDNDSHCCPSHIACTFAQYRMDQVFLLLEVALGAFWGR